MMSAARLAAWAIGLAAIASGAAGQERGQPATAAAAAAPDPRAKPSPQAEAETLEEIVARVRRRLAEEQAAARRPASPRPQPPPRVTLVWRPSVVWPSELTAPAGEHHSDRTTLTWTSLPPADAGGPRTSPSEAEP
jgi:hypothetical protein